VDLPIHTTGVGIPRFLADEVSGFIFQVRIRDIEDGIAHTFARPGRDFVPLAIDLRGNCSEMVCAYLKGPHEPQRLGMPNLERRLGDGWQVNSTNGSAMSPTNEPIPAHLLTAKLEQLYTHTSHLHRPETIGSIIGGWWCDVRNRSSVLTSSAGGEKAPNDGTTHTQHIATLPWTRIECARGEGIDGIT